MGHLTHATGFRVGKSVPWLFNYHRYDFDGMHYINIYMAYDAYIKKNFQILFRSISLKLLYSHVKIRPYRRFTRLTLFMFNGFLDIYIRRFRLTMLPKIHFFKLKDKYAHLRKSLRLTAFYKNSLKYRQPMHQKYYRLFARFLTWHFRYDFRNVAFLNKGNPLFLRFVHLSFRSITAKVLANYIIRRLKLGYSINSIVKPLISEAKKVASFRGIFIKFKGRLTRKQRAVYNKRILKFGKIGFSTVSEKVDYAYVRYITRYGSCSIKVWICRRSLGIVQKIKSLSRNPFKFQLAAEVRSNIHQLYRKRIAFKKKKQSGRFFDESPLPLRRDWAKRYFSKYVWRLKYWQYFSSVHRWFLLKMLLRKRFLISKVKLYLP